MPETDRVLHLVLVRAKVDVEPPQLDHLVTKWAALRPFPGVSGIGAVPVSAGGTHHLALYAFLPSLPASEEFGTDVRHMAFLRDAFIPVLEGFAGADLFVSGSPPSDFRSVLCVLMQTTDGVYDWQTKAALDALLADSGAIALCRGLAINTRQRYQAGGLLFFAEINGATTYAESERFHRLREQRWREVTIDVALVWGPGGPIGD